MLVSHAHRFLFVHVPKTAGTSVTTALAPFCHHPEQAPVNRLLACAGINVNWLGPLDWRRGRKHTTANQMRQVFPRRVYDSYFKFAFVRNPWDLMVSYYHYIKANAEHHRQSRVAGLRCFGDYIKYEIRRNTISQSGCLTDRSGELLVDYVGRFENLKADFADVCARIGVAGAIAKRNRSDHRDYRTYYDDTTAQLVADHWREDICRFGYTFDDFGDAASISRSGSALVSHSASEGVSR